MAEGGQGIARRPGRSRHAVAPGACSRWAAFLVLKANLSREDAMRQPVHHIQGEFHPGVFKAVVLLAALYVLAAWGFAGHGITDMLLAVVSGFFLLSIGLVTLLWRTRRRNPRIDLGDRVGELDSFRSWVGHDVETSTGPVRGSVAMIETLLPIAAVAVGMMAFALVVHFVAHA
jgi:hypothetical protein